MPIYEIKPEHGSPCWDIWKDGVKHRNFTSRTGAQAWLDHVAKHGEQTKLAPRVIVAGNINDRFRQQLEDRLNGVVK